MTAPLPPRWLRRWLLRPLFFMFGMTLFVGLLPVALLAWSMLVIGMPAPLRALRLLAFGWVYLGIELVVIVAAFALWLASGFGRGLQQPTFVERHYRLLAAGVETLVRCGTRAFALNVDGRVSAVAVSDRPLLVLSRHAGPGDSLLLIHQLLGRTGRRPRIVLKHSLQWDPMIDLVFNRLPMAFVDPGSTRHAGTLARIAEVAASMTPGDALLIFPEGRNVNPNHRRRAIERLRRAGRETAARRAESIQHLMIPRSRGLQAALAARPDLDVALVAHAGLDDLHNARDMWHAVPRVKTLQLQWRVVAAEEVPKDPEALATWLFAQWQHMDRWVGRHRAGAAVDQSGKTSVSTSVCDCAP